MHTAIPASQLGTLVDSRYRLHRLVGEGASSWVFAATDQRLEREVALKLFKQPANADDSKRRKRCVAEGRTLAKLVHPHIVAIHDASEDGSGQAYLVMELCEAGTLEDELTQRGQLALSEALRLVFPLMGALAFAHDRKIVHRDIKPGNIVLVEEHGEQRCKLLDFGISLGTGVGLSSDLALGTPAYMAPEQARGEPTTPATDVWALGVVLFRCLTGRLPFDASTQAGVLLQVVQGRAPRLSSVCSVKHAPKVLQALDRALEPDLARRYADVRSFARALAVTATLDGIPLVRRPEPIGLPEFDSWVLSAKDSPTTAPLPVAAMDSASLVAARRPLGRAARAAVAAALVCLVGGAAWALSYASERSRAAAVTRASAAPRAGVAHARPIAPQNVDAGPSPLRATLSEEQAAPALPAREPNEAKPAASKSSRRRKVSEPDSPPDAPSEQSPAPRLITHWDW